MEVNIATRTENLGGGQIARKRIAYTGYTCTGYSYTGYRILGMVYWVWYTGIGILGMVYGYRILGIVDSLCFLGQPDILGNKLTFYLVDIEWNSTAIHRLNYNNLNHTTE